MLTRRRFLICSAAAAVAAHTAKASPPCKCRKLAGEIEAAIRRAIDYLVIPQGEDGAWRSNRYGPFKDGPSLTSFIAAIFTGIKNRHDVELSLQKAARFLAETIEKGGQELTYPTYTAAGAVVSLNRRAKFAEQQKAWLDYLRSLQLTEEHGWDPADLAYGGWSYVATGLQPSNGVPATPLAVPNLSATVFALQALRAAGVETSDPAVRRARLFIERCQNWPDDRQSRDDKFDDGGFHFLLEDPRRNKAGEVGIDHSGRQRFASYGSATADGFQSSALCGLESEHPRRMAAEKWLRRNFSAETHPGDYQPDREHLRPTLYYYYAASMSRCFQFSGLLRRRAPELAQAILSRQRADGSWSNQTVDVREDDPLVATPLAVQALYDCRDA